jgi:hypothetical protein
VLRDRVQWDSQPTQTWSALDLTLHRPGRIVRTDIPQDAFMDLLYAFSDHPHVAFARASPGVARSESQTDLSGLNRGLVLHHVPTFAARARYRDRRCLAANS